MKVPWFEAVHVPQESPALARQTGLLVRDTWVSDQGLFPPDIGPIPPHHQKRLIRVLEEYLTLCAIAETRFPIITGYCAGRCPGHYAGYAIDIAPVGYWTVGQMYAMTMIYRRERESKLRGVGLYKNHLHLDVAPRGWGRGWVKHDNYHLFGPYSR